MAMEPQAAQSDESWMGVPVASNGPAPTPFANVINVSARAFANLKDAENRLGAVMKDLQRSESELSAFPSAHERASAKYDAAKLEYDEAVERSSQASSPLNALMHRLCAIMAAAGTKAMACHDPASIPPSVEARCREIVDQRLSELKQQNSQVTIGFEARMRALESELKRSNDKTDALIKSINANQKAIQDLQMSLQERRREEMTRAESVVQSMASQKAEIGSLKELMESANHKLLDVQTILDKSQHTRAVGQDSQESNYQLVENILERVNEIDKRITEDQKTLKIAEGELNNIYHKLSAIEGASRSSSSQDRDSRAVQLDADKTPQRQTERLKSHPQHHRIPENMQQCSHSELVPIPTADQTTIRRLERGSKEISAFAAGFNNFQQQVDVLEGDNSIKLALGILQQQVAGMQDQIRGFVMTIQHLNKKFDELSAEEIVTKINMSLRNASNKTVLSLGNQLQGISHTTSEKLGILDKRVTTIEHSLCTAPV